MAGQGIQRKGGGIMVYMFTPRANLRGSQLRRYVRKLVGRIYHDMKGRNLKKGKALIRYEVGSPVGALIGWLNKLGWSYAITPHGIHVEFELED